MFELWFYFTYSLRIAIKIWWSRYVSCSAISNADNVSKLSFVGVWKEYIHSYFRANSECFNNLNQKLWSKWSPSFVQQESRRVYGTAVCIEVVHLIFMLKPLSSTYVLHVSIYYWIVTSHFDHISKWGWVVKARTQAELIWLQYNEMFRYQVSMGLLHPILIVLANDVELVRLELVKFIWSRCTMKCFYIKLDLIKGWYQVRSTIGFFPIILITLENEIELWRLECYEMIIVKHSSLGP